MATTVANTIERAMRLIGALTEGETPTATQYNEAFAALNSFVDSLNAERLPLFREAEASYTITTAQSYTIGPSGATFTATRPERIVSALYRTDSTAIDFPLDIINKVTWDAIPLKVLTDVYPRVLWYDESYPNGTLNLWPQAAGNLVLTTAQQITEFASTSETLAMPPGYRDMLAFNLALLLAPEYQATPPAVVVQMAAKSLGRLKAKNQRTDPSQIEIAAINRQQFNIQTGTNY